MKILYNFPTRSRPEKALACLKNIEYMSGSENFFCVLKIDHNDPLCNNSYFINKATEFHWVSIVLGHSNNKVHAINRDIPDTGWDIIISVADDLYINQKGFDNIIRAEYESGFRGALHIMEQYGKDRLLTFPILHKDYYEIDSYIYNPSYSNVYCDNEMQEVAKIRGQYRLHPAHGIFEHRNPICGSEYGEPDELLLKTENPIGYVRDRNVYEKRKSINFGL